MTPFGDAEQPAGPSWDGGAAGYQGRIHPAPSPVVQGTGRPATRQGSGRRPVTARAGRLVPRMNLLAPRMPARRVRVAARWTAALLVLASLDLVAGLGWLGVNGLASRAERALRQAEARRLAAEAAVAPLVPAAREKAALQRRWEALQAIGDPPWEAAAVLAAARASLPGGVTLSRMDVEGGGAVHLSGMAPSYAAVDQYARALAAAGFFRGVWVRQMAVTGAAAPSPSPGTGGPVTGSVPGSASEWGGSVPDGEQSSSGGGTGAGLAGSPGPVAFDIDAWLAVAGSEPSNATQQGGQP